MKSIDSCLDVTNSRFVKNVIIAGFLDSSKTFIVMYIVIYSYSKGLIVVTLAMTCHSSIQLGGWHWNKLSCIPVDRERTCLCTA